MAGISSLTDRNAVLETMAEYDRRGRDAFLDHYHFGQAKWWYVLHGGRQYDSKAIVGAAIGYQTGKPLTSNDFGGGAETVVRKLRSLRFEVVRHEITEESSSLAEEVAETFPEGMRTTVTVNRAERSPRARIACLAIHGTSCSVCKMSFEQVYGSEFAGFIHVHHLAALSETSDVRFVNPETDLRPVCPNCHSAIHYGGVTRSIEEVRSMLTQSES